MLSSPSVCSSSSTRYQLALLLFAIFFSVGNNRPLAKSANIWYLLWLERNQIWMDIKNQNFDILQPKLHWPLPLRIESICLGIDLFDEGNYCKGYLVRMPRIPSGQHANRQLNLWFKFWKLPDHSDTRLPQIWLDWLHARCGLLKTLRKWKKWIHKSIVWRHLCQYVCTFKINFI